VTDLSDPFRGQACLIVVPIVAGNRASWRALEKAGFVRIAEGDLAPDNPVDPAGPSDLPPRPAGAHPHLKLIMQ
jgi:aminoglycoside 6'-N-acetyltransferase